MITLPIKEPIRTNKNLVKRNSVFHYQSFRSMIILFSLKILQMDNFYDVFKG